MKILIVDAFPLLRDALTGLIARQFQDARVTTVGGLDADEARHAVDMDLILAGLHAADRLTTERLAPGARAPAIAIDTRADQRRARELREAGWRGHVSLDTPVELFGAVMNLVVAGGSYFPLLTSETPSKTPSDTARLSTRQLEVLALLEQGRSNREIAADLGIAVSTVKLHVHSILHATGARNRTEAALVRRRSDA